MLLPTTEAAKILGVSPATIRNWAKVGHIVPVALKPAAFRKTDVLDLQERIRTNRFNRLRKRANKSASGKIEASEVANALIAADMEAFLDVMRASGADAGAIVFMAALRYLAAKGEARLPDSGPIPDSMTDLSAVSWRRPPVGEVMTRWFARNGSRLYPVPASLTDAFLTWEQGDDRLGLLYQGLSSEGKKSRTGAYFTPSHIIDASHVELAEPAAAQFGGGAAEEVPSSYLDPCCGTGRYLLRAARRFRMDPSRLYGFDADPVAVDIACINLLLEYPALDFVPRVECLDSLRDLANGQPGCQTNALLGTIDAIATNPPWGGCKNRVRHRHLEELVKSGESFSLFLEKSLRLLREGGRLSFVLPEAVLKIKTHADIRRVLLEETSIRGITLLGKVFSGVTTSIIRLDVVKRPSPPGWQVHVDCGGRAHEVPQERFSRNAHCAFDVTVNGDDARLIGKIYSVPHETLKGNAEWALGIVTGDNSKCVLNEPCPGSEPVLRGRDVFKFASRPPRCHLVFKPKRFQQVAPERYYRAPEKLVYRFVSNRLVFAYDSERRLTLNSANIVIPRLPHMSMKACLAFLNSTVFQYIFLKRFQTKKILRGDLETLPFPRLETGLLRRLEDQVARCMGGEYQPAEELDRMIYEVFGLTADEVSLLEEGVRADSARDFL